MILSNVRKDVINNVSGSVKKSYDGIVWSPLNVASLILLFDFSDFSTMFTDEAGTTPVTSVSQTVASFRDKKSNILFTQSTPSSRSIIGRHPVSGLRNRIQRTEVYDNSFWTKNGTTVAVNAAANPLNGAITADRIWPTSVNNQKNVLVSWYKTGSSQQFTFSVYAKASGYNTLLLQMDAGSDTNSIFASFDLSNGTASATTVAGTYGSGSATISDLGSGWYRCSITVTTGSETTLRIVHWIDSRSAYIGANSSTTGILLWGSQLEQGTLSTYQTVVGGEDITEPNVDSRYFLYNSGATTQWYEATVDLSAISTLTSCFGYRLATIGNRQILSHNGTSTPNFGVVGTSGALLQADSRGNGTNRNATVSGLLPQQNFVGTTFHSINGPLVQAHYNTTIGASNVLSQGTGNFNNGPVRFMSRTDTALTASGYHYALALFSAILSGDELTKTKQWIANKTGVTL